MLRPRRKATDKLHRCSFFDKVIALMIGSHTIIIFFRGILNIMSTRVGKLESGPETNGDWNVSDALFLQVSFDHDP